jgi:competence protein ComEC
VGIAVYFLLRVEPPGWLGAALLMGLGCGGLLYRRRPGLWLLILALGMVAAGFTAAQLRTALVAAPVLEKKLGPVTVTGKVLSAEPREGGGRVVLSSPDLPGLAPEATPERVRVKLTGRDPSNPQPGEWVRLRAVLRPPPGPAAPGAFDFARQAYFARLGAVGYAVRHAEVLEIPPAGMATVTSGPRGAWRLWWSGLRHRIARRVLAALPGERGAIAAALMTGERGAIPEPVVEAMRDSGLAHLLAISGLHMGLVAGLLFFGIRALLALVPSLALNHPIKKWAAVAAAAGGLAYLLLVGAAYLLLVGATVPSQRAFLMVSVVLLAVLLDRSAISLRLVAWAALVILLLAPESLLSASFQMSFAAVTALVAGYEVVTLRRAGRAAERGMGRRMAFYLAGVALTSVIAILATAPFAVYHFNRMAWYGLAANLVAVPLTGFWIMPWALVAFALMPFGLEALALQPMGWGIGAVIAVAEDIAGLPGAVTPVRALPLAGFALIVLGGLWLCLWQRPWRLYGLIAVALGLLSLPLARPPDLLVSEDGKLMALRDPDGRMWLSSTRTARFTAETWLRRAGQGEGLSWPNGVEGRPSGLICDSLGCIYRRAGWSVALAQRKAALEEDCREVRVLISREPVPKHRCRGPEVVIDRFDLWREGGHALWLAGEEVRVESVADRRGARPWVPRRAWERTARSVQ